MLVSSRGVSPITLNTRPGAVVQAEFDSTIYGLFVGWSIGGSPWIAWERPNDTKRDLYTRYDAMRERIKRQHENRNARNARGNR